MCFKLGFLRCRAAAVAAALGVLVLGSAATAGACKEKPVQKLLGRPYTEPLRDKAQAASHATIVEDLRRGEATTTEFRGDRLDIVVDPKTNVVVGLWCG